MQQFLDETNDMRRVPGSEREVALLSATKKCNELKVQLINAQQKESAAAIKQQSARDQLASAEDDVLALETRLSALNIQETESFNDEPSIQQQTSDLVRSAKSLLEDLAARNALPGRDFLAKGSVLAAAREAVQRDPIVAPAAPPLGGGVRLRPNLVVEKLPAKSQAQQVLCSCYPVRSNSKSPRLMNFIVAELISCVLSPDI
jgi:hypothetical protein